MPITQGTSSGGRASKDQRGILGEHGVVPSGQSLATLSGPTPTYQFSIAGIGRNRTWEWVPHPFGRAV